MQLRDIGKRLEHEQINSAFKQRRYLSREHLFRFIERCGSVRLNAQAQRPNSTSHQHSISRGLASDLSGPNIYLAETSFQSVRLELVGGSAESICLDDVSAGAHVFGVHFADEVGSDQIQFIVRSINVDALGIEHRAHRAIKHVGAVGFD